MEVKTEQEIVIGHSGYGATSETCDVLYNEGDNFETTFTQACNLLKERNFSTIKILFGEYLFGENYEQA